MAQPEEHFAIWLKPQPDGRWRADLVAEDGALLSVGRFDTQDAARQGARDFCALGLPRLNQMLARARG